MKARGQFILVLVILILILVMSYLDHQDYHRIYTCEIIYLDGGKDTTAFNGIPKLGGYRGVTTTLSAHQTYRYNVSRYTILRITSTQ